MQIRVNKPSFAPRTAVGYVRVSTSKQDLSPAAQSRAIERWCAREGWELQAVYLDIGVSGGKGVGARPGLLAALTSGAPAIVVAKRDRLARDLGVSVDIDRLAETQRTRILSAEGGNGEDDVDALRRDFDAVFSAHERRVIRRRTRDALAVKRDRGERLGVLPYGCRATGPGHCAACAAHAPDHRGLGLHIEPDPGEQAVIARAKALSDEGLTVRGIASALAAEGVRNRRGKPLAFQSVYAFLRPLLAG